ncbi:L-amino acid amidase [Podospora fimiseda]|uniref:L-amino acid amidase n=1 Tax=Podospora fimiseda TaxID=252190 RepID=A0AAN7BJC3_9PEZI|nr:L-amino acid amidase [Podospora fimiseda]
MTPEIREGEVDFDAPGAGKPSKTWYKIVGSLESGSTPLILLHGGPGAGHEYLSSLIDLYHKHGTPLIFYDQIGYKGFYILGQSWGGILAGAYASRRPKGLLKAVIHSGPASIPLYVKGCNDLLAALPPDVRRTLEDCERRGDHESEEFEKASAVFYGRHVCRLDPYPDDVLMAFKHLKEDPTAYLTLQGPSEFVIIGSLKEWEGWQDAHKIEVETLLINARYDEVTSLSIEPWFKHIPKVKWVTLENSSHMAHYEERERFMEIVGEFLSK